MNKKYLKKIFRIMCLGPFSFLLSVPEGTGEENKTDETGNVGNTKDESKESENDKNENNDAGKIVFNSQKEFDDTINRRIAKAIKSEQKKHEDEKQKASLTETEKLKKEKEDAEKNAERRVHEADKRLIKAETIKISSTLGIIDSDAAYALMGKDDIEVDVNGNVIGVEKALKTLIATKPYLIKSSESVKKAGVDVNDKNKDQINQNRNFNAMIRRAAGIVD